MFSLHTFPCPDYHGAFYLRPQDIPGSVDEPAQITGKGYVIEAVFEQFTPSLPRERVRRQEHRSSKTPLFDGTPMVKSAESGRMPYLSVRRVKVIGVELSRMKPLSAARAQIVVLAQAVNPDD